MAIPPPCVIRAQKPLITSTFPTARLIGGVNEMISTFPGTRITRAATVTYGRRTLTTTPATPTPATERSRAFSSEVDTGSREENASNKKIEPPFRFNRNGKGSGGLKYLSFGSPESPDR